MEHPSCEHHVLPFHPRRPVIEEDDLAPLIADHVEVRRMCREVEALADRLADPPSLMERCAAASLIHATAATHVRVTSTFLDEAFAGERLKFSRSILKRILLGQISDAIHAEDVVEILRSERLDATRIDALSYMLRCLFDSCRRSLAFEEMALLSIAGDRLTHDARLALESMLECAEELG